MNRCGVISRLFLSSFVLSPTPAIAAQYVCTVNSVLGLTDSGQYATHEWENFYLERQFVVDRDQGKVISTTALKARLKNFDANNSPKVLSHGDKNHPFKSISIFENTGEFAVLQINENFAGDAKPFYYQTYIGMLLAGTCIGDDRHD
ncbi:MAG: hypothetical protein HYR49_03360 [Gammaproteobacteria bacterium]|nr:hypothetical protein [Gammaproteobacteria bacterium]